MARVSGAARLPFLPLSTEGDGPGSEQAVHKHPAYHFRGLLLRAGQGLEAVGAGQKGFPKETPWEACPRRGKGQNGENLGKEGPRSRT